MDKAGFLVRIKDEVRVDQIPRLMEANPTKAVLIEKVKDTEFSVLANAYSNQEMFAWAMGCGKTRTGHRAFGNLRHKLGRANDPPWYRYTLSATPFLLEAKPQPVNQSDPRHVKTAG
jgi:UbiD family decarboxylase